MASATANIVAVDTEVRSHECHTLVSAVDGKPTVTKAQAIRRRYRYQALVKVTECWCLFWSRVFHQGRSMVPKFYHSIRIPTQR